VQSDKFSQPQSTPSRPALVPALSPPTTKHTPNHLDDSTTETTSDTQIRLENAYPGATNTIKSIHQRKWFLSLDRFACGFRPTKEISFGRKVWERPLLRVKNGVGNGMSERGGFEPFHVLGRDVERSVVTGRLAGEVAVDEGLVGYKPRGGWKGITD
jgi:hypothetical protein